MATVWCPVRLLSGDRDLIESIQSLCSLIGATDFQSFTQMEDRRQQDALAQLVIIDLNSTAESADENLSLALKRKPRDVVVGIGGGFRGSAVAHWARLGMHSLVDSPFRESDLPI